MGMLTELRRRRVIRVAGLYAVGAWITTEVSATVLPLLQVPEQFVTGIVITLVVMFPITMIFAWIYDIGPAGIKKTPKLSEDKKTTGQPGMVFHISLLVLVMVVFGYGLFYLGQTRALQAVPRSSIAVLPFQNLSNDAGKDYFSDGISEEILNLLAQVEGLSVAARTSSFVYRDANEDIRTIGSNLGVEAVLEGSVRWTPDSNRVRITAQLIDASSGYHLWSNNFDRDLKDIFAVQSEIAKAIVDNLRIELGADQAAWVAPTTNADAYDLYLRGRQLLNQRRIVEVRASIDYFQRAVALDPAFAPALAAMAVAYVSLPILSGEPVEQLHSLAEAAVQKVLTLSPELAEAHSVRAWLAQYNGEWRRAEFGYFAATSMDPNDVTTRIWYSGFLVAAGKLTQGQTQADRALDLDPNNPLTRAAMAMAEMIRGDDEACINSAIASRELGFAAIVNNLHGICLARLGHLTEASNALLAANGPMARPGSLASLATELPDAGNLRAAAEIANSSGDEWRNDPFAVWLWAIVEDTDRVFARLEQSAGSRLNIQMMLLWTPEAAAVRRDPRFLPFMRDSGIARVWRNDPPDLCGSADDEPFHCY